MAAVITPHRVYNGSTACTALTWTMVNDDDRVPFHLHSLLSTHPLRGVVGKVRYGERTKYLRTMYTVRQHVADRETSRSSTERSGCWQCTMMYEVLRTMYLLRPMAHVTAYLNLPVHASMRPCVIASSINSQWSA